MGRVATATKTCPDCKLTRAHTLFGRKGQFDSCNDCRRVTRAAEPPAESRTCNVCNQTQSLDAFEVTTKDGKCRRAVCMPCYSTLRKHRTKIGAANHDPDSTPKPDACVNCGRGRPEDDFRWRSDVKNGGWRTECNACLNEKGYSEACRERKRLDDEVSDLAHNKKRLPRPSYLEPRPRRRARRGGGIAVAGGGQAVG